MAGKDELGVLIQVSPDKKSVDRMAKEIEKQLKGASVKIPIEAKEKLDEKSKRAYVKGWEKLLKEVEAEQKKADKLRESEFNKSLKKQASDAEKAAKAIAQAQAKAQKIINDSSTQNFRTSGVVTKAQNSKVVSASGLMSAQNKYNTALSAVNLNDAASVKALINAEQQLINVRKQVSAQLSNVSAEQRNATATDNLVRKIENYLKVNGKIKAQGGELYGEAIGIVEDIKSGTISSNAGEQQFANLRTRIKEAGLEAKTFGQSIKEAFGRYAAIGFATTGLLMIKQTLKQMVVAVKELDKAIVDLQIATGMTYDQANALLSTYTQLGKEMGATTVQVAQAADAYLRQGKTIEETEILVRQSLMLSKLGQIDSAEATQYLTSAMKGYKVEVEDVSRITDRLTAVDMEAAVSAGGIAEAMSMTANGARLAGVSMDKLIGIMTAVGEVSQQDWQNSPII